MGNSLLESMMRGPDIHQDGMFSYVTPEERVPQNHPLRRIRVLVESALRRMDSYLEAAYAKLGRPSIPPERLLKGQLLIALFSIRGDRQLCEQLDYNIMFRWFLGYSMDEPVFSHSTFSQNRERFLEHDVAGMLLAEVTQIAREEGLLNDECFSVDGTLIDAWASMKSFKPIESDSETQTDPSSDSTDDDDNDPGNPTVNFRGQKRTNKTHRSTTDPDARLYKKGAGKSSQLCHMGHVLMDNQHGLISKLSLTEANGTAEIDALLAMLAEFTEDGRDPREIAADAGYHTRECFEQLAMAKIQEHIARHPSRKTLDPDDKHAQSQGYKLAQQIRKRVEEIFGWMKTIGGIRKSRFRGTARTGQAYELVGTAYNLVRMAKLMGAPA